MRLDQKSPVSGGVAGVLQTQDGQRTNRLAVNLLSDIVSIRSKPTASWLQLARYNLTTEIQSLRIRAKFVLLNAKQKKNMILAQFDKILQHFTYFYGILGTFLCAKFSVRKLGCKKELTFRRSAEIKHKPFRI